MPKPAEVARKVYLFVDSSDAAAELAVSFLISAMIGDTADESPSLLRLCPSPEDTMVRTMAIRFGFRPQAGSSARAGKLEKICLGGVVTDDNWFKSRAVLEQSIGITLPRDPPNFRAPDDEIRIGSNGGYAITTVGALEELLSPVIFALGERPAAIVPITPDYAEELFRGSTQPSLLEGAQAALLHEKRYFSDARTYRVIPEDGVIVFYESAGRGQGRSAATAVARIRRRYLAEEAIATGLASQKGVLSPDAVQAMARGKSVCNGVRQFEIVQATCSVSRTQAD
jgi:hypothetical protein